MSPKQLLELITEYHDTTEARRSTLEIIAEVYKTLSWQEAETLSSTNNFLLGFDV